MFTNTEFPFHIDPPRTRLLAGYRTEIDRLEAVARGQLCDLTRCFDGEGSMLADFVDLALADHHWLNAAVNDLREHARRAIDCDPRDGWDTWPPKALDRAIKALLALADTLQALDRVWHDLARAETLEFRALSA